MQSTISVTPRRRSSNRIPYHQILWLEPLWLAIIAIPILMPGLLPERAQPLAVSALLLFWPIRWLLQRQGLTVFHGLHPMLGMMLLWLPLTIWIAINQQSAWITTGYTLLGITLYIGAVNQPWLRRRPIYLGRALLLLSALLVIVSPAIVQWKSEFRLFYTPIYDWFQLIPITIGETVHANILAGALVQLCAITLALALPPVQTKIAADHTLIGAKDEYNAHEGRQRYIRIKFHRVDRIQRWVMGCMALLLMTLLILTQSRGAYLALAIMLVVLGVLRWPRLRILLPILAFAAVAAVYLYGLDASFELLGADNTFGGADWRSSVWHAAGQALHDFPYTGIGIGDFRAVLPVLYPHPALEMDSANHAHNLFMQIGLDIGLVGLTAYYLFNLAIFWLAIQRLRQRNYSVSNTVEPHKANQPNQANARQRKKALVRHARRHTENWALTAGAFAAMIGIQIHGLLDAVTWGTKLAFLPWLLFAIIVLCSQSETNTSLVERSSDE